MTKNKLYIQNLHIHKQLSAGEREVWQTSGLGFCYWMQSDLGGGRELYN